MGSVVDGGDGGAGLDMARALRDLSKLAMIVDSYGTGRPPLADDDGGDDRGARGIAKPTAKSRRRVKGRLGLRKMHLR